MDENELDNANFNCRNFFYINQLINTGNEENLKKSEKIHKATEKAYNSCAQDDEEYSIFGELEKRVKEIEYKEEKEIKRFTRNIKNSIFTLKFEDQQPHREDFQMWNMEREELKFSDRLIENAKAFKYNKIFRHILKKKHIKLSQHTKFRKKDRTRIIFKESDLEGLNDTIRHSVVKSLVEKDK